MALYIRPSSIFVLPQGDFEFQPEVKLFAGYTDITVLQTDMNTFMSLVVLDPGLRYNIENVQFNQGISGAPSSIVYSAMIWFTRIENI